jgi:hypothetical protein
MNASIEKQTHSPASPRGARILEHKCALVFGAGGSIGAAVASEFAAEGARVFLVGRTKSGIEPVAEHINANGGVAQTAAIDVLDDADVNQFVDATGPLAKEYENGKIAVELPIEEFMVPLATIVKARFITARAAARHMIAQKSGVIIFVTGRPARVTRSGYDRHRRGIRRDRESRRKLGFRGQPIRCPGCVPSNPYEYRRPIHSGHHGRACRQVQYHQGPGHGCPIS